MTGFVSRNFFLFGFRESKKERERECERERVREIESVVSLIIFNLSYKHAMRKYLAEF